MNPKKNLKKFILYSDNLIRVSSSIFKNLVIEKQQFLCPICFQIIEDIEENIEQNKPVITLEHIPPLSVGGSETTLTCQQCNNNSGSIEKDIKAKFQNEKFFKEKYGYKKAKFSINGNILNGELGYDEAGKLEFKFIKERSKPLDFLKSIEQFKIQNSKIDIDFTIPTYNSTNFRFSVYKALYLKAFAHLGYAFLFIEEISEIRLKLVEFLNKRGNFELPILLCDNFEREGVFLIKSPEALIGYFVVLEFKLENITHKYGTIFPCKRLERNNVIKVLQNKLSKSEIITFDYASINEIDFFDSKNTFWPLRIPPQN